MSSTSFIQLAVDDLVSSSGALSRAPHDGEVKASGAWSQQKLLTHMALPPSTMLQISTLYTTEHSTAKDQLPPC